MVLSAACARDPGREEQVPHQQQRDAHLPRVERTYVMSYHVKRMSPAPRDALPLGCSTGQDAHGEAERERAEEQHGLGLAHGLPRARRDATAQPGLADRSAGVARDDLRAGERTRALASVARQQPSQLHPMPLLRTSQVKETLSSPHVCSRPQPRAQGSSASSSPAAAGSWLSSKQLATVVGKGIARQRDDSVGRKRQRTRADQFGF